jgi:hypothetical protein
MDWYCIVRGEQRGPMELAELQELVRGGVVGPDDYVWTASFGSAWRRARDVPEMLPPAAPTATDPPAGPAGAAPVFEARAVFRTPLAGVPGRAPRTAAAIADAWERMAKLLFRPLDLARWFSIGFCAWLATLTLQDVLVIVPTPIRVDPARLQALQSAGSLRDLSRQSVHELTAALTGLTPAQWAVFALVLAAGALAAQWVCARGAFALLHRWLHPEETVGAAWRAGRDLGRSLFLFRLGFGAAMLALTALAGVGAFASVAAPLLHGAAWSPEALTWLIVWVMVALLIVATWVSVLMLVDQFVVPVMYWRRVGVLEAWRPVWELCVEHPWPVVIYLAVLPLLGLAAAAATAALVLGTCCVAIIPLVIPYLRAVLLLPATLFFRGLGVSFLRQWRGDLERQ